MTVNEYDIKINEQRRLELQDESLEDVLKFYVLFSGTKKLSFYEYNYEINNFQYEFTINKDDKIDDKSEMISLESSSHSIVIEDSHTKYGMLTFNDIPNSSDLIDDLLKKIEKVLQRRFTLKKELLSQEATLDIFLITDEKSKIFASEVNDSLNALLNVNIIVRDSAVSISEQLKEKTKKSILIYVVDDITLLKKDKEVIQLLNEIVIVIGPDDYDLSLFCGQLKVHKYFTRELFKAEEIKKIIIESKNQINNKYINQNKIISISGISGGIGTTTAAMNVANLLAIKNPDENVLFIDLSMTKAVSNLFLAKDPLPKKTIIDLINSNEFSVEKSLENGLVKVRENFYAINGIQKHIDAEFLDQDIFIEKLLEYISIVSIKFNYIVIDAGQAEASQLKSTIYDISNELWILTEMSLPHISKLKTFFTLMKRAGLKEKLTFLVSRYNSKNAISVADVTSILHTEHEDNLNFDFKIPNNYTLLGYCWNYCELITQTKPDSPYVKAITKILSSKKLIKQEEQEKNTTKNWFSFLK